MKLTVGALRGQHVAITGVGKNSRRVLVGFLRKHGAKPQKMVTRKTNILVVGRGNPVWGDDTEKRRRAQALLAQNSGLNEIDIDSFERLVERSSSVRTRPPVALGGRRRTKSKVQTGARAARRAKAGEGGRPVRPRRRAAGESTAGGQGYERDPAVRAAIDRRAMQLAIAHYKASKYTVENTASTHPFDLRCKGAGREVRVEVKGTRGDGSTVAVTIGEVKSARGKGWRTDLFIVSGIRVTAGNPPVARGGKETIVRGWVPSVADLEALTYRCRVPRRNAVPANR